MGPTACCGAPTAPADLHLSHLCADCPLHALWRGLPSDYKLRHRSPIRSRTARGLKDAAKARARAQSPGPRVQS